MSPFEIFATVTLFAVVVQFIFPKTTGVDELSE